MEDARKPAIAITMGDPCGIGPEVVVKALADPWVYAACRPLVVGNTYAMEQAVKLTGSSLQIRPSEDPADAGRNPRVVDVVDIGNLNTEDITVGEINPRLMPGISLAGSRRNWGMDARFCSAR